jgi:hypothetical protein
MVSRITVILERDERAALARLAMSERRDPRKQAAVLIRRGLELAGVLESDADRQRQSDNQRQRVSHV